MPYRFEKRKKQLLKQAEKFNEVHSERHFDLEDILQNEDDKIEEEFLKLKDVLTLWTHSWLTSPLTWMRLQPEEKP